MASMEIEDNFPIEFLPAELVEHIAAFLTAKDLAAYCAVSCRMRDIFNDDLLWRGHCDRKLEEYLRTTACKVEPPFTSPETKNSTLSPISYWRMAFMRENHLWNNWRQGKSISEEIINQNSEYSKYNSICHIFHTNDVILGFFRDRIELLDVREYPAADATRPIRPHQSFTEETQLRSNNNMILVIDETWVQVYDDVNFSVKFCALKHEFSFDHSEKLAVSGECVHRSTKKSIHTMIGKWFIGVIKGESTMHIWDLETGRKLKEEVCPMLKSCEIVEIKTSNTMNLVINVKVGSNNVIILAYSLTRLTYFSFKETYRTDVQFYVCENFVGIYSNSCLNVYSYQANELVLKGQSASSHPQFLHNNFVFVDDQMVKVFNPKTRVLKSTPLKEIDSFEIMCDRFIQVKQEWRTEIWEIRGVFEEVKKTSMELWFDACAFFLNNACTRYIVRTAIGSVIHFW